MGVLSRGILCGAWPALLFASVPAQGPGVPAKLRAADGAQADHFADSVAIDADTVLVGASGDDDRGPGSGSAYVFVRAGTGWVQQQKLRARTGEAHDAFGYAVALEGSAALAGAYFGGANDVGSAYVFRRAGARWSQEAELTPPDGAPGDYYGTSVALSAERGAETAVVGAPYHAVSGLDRAGAAYVFRRVGGAWGLDGKLVAADARALDHFGYSVAAGGRTLLVGAFGTDPKGHESGSAYVFERDAGGWTQAAELGIADGRPYDWFGYSVALDGDTALVGVPFDDDKGFDSGSARVFVRRGAAWIQEAQLLASDGADFAAFGWSVALAGDTAVVGAYGVHGAGPNSGAAYVFVRGPGPRGQWTQRARIAPADGAPGDRFGWSVAKRGIDTVVGALLDDGRGSALVWR